MNKQTIESLSPMNLTQHIGYDLLGPILHRWLLGLHQHISYFKSEDTTYLFCARAGLRIQELYNIFLTGAADNSNDARTRILWASRLSVAKGTFRRNQIGSIKIIAREYKHEPLRNAVRGLLKNYPEITQSLDLSGRDLDAHGFNFPGWITVRGNVQSHLISYLDDCSSALDTYLSEKLADKKRILLIDSGWQGTTQSLLTKAYPNYQWKGLYFGRILTGDHDPNIVDNVVGILFEKNKFDPNVPESAFVEHRHLIETLLESNGPSIEEIPANQLKKIADDQIERNLCEIPDPLTDGLYLAARSYLIDHATKLGFKDIFSRHSHAMRELARIILTPTREEARAVICKDRSADFGKATMVPVLIDNENNLGPDERISRSLWKQGQIALEYKGQIARELQQRIIGYVNDVSNFDPLDDASTEISRSLDLVPPTIAIITRTKNRPLLLERAARSVASQSYTNYVWVVVNDGGDEKSVEDVINSSLVDRRRIIVVHNNKSHGMEAASNLGIRNSKSDYVVIHDDDDSWHPNFLNKAISFLEKPSGKRYGGVVSHSTYISEEIKNSKVIEYDRMPYQDWVQTIHLVEMACGNFFPPIAFVYRRKIWEQIGGYDEELPVLGDWMFNLEFLLRADIGVIVEPLAFYHHRDHGDSRSGLYSNSVIGGVSKHEEFTAIAINRFLRKNLHKFPAAAAVVQAYGIREMRSLKKSTNFFPRPPSDTATKLRSARLVTAEQDITWLSNQIKERLSQHNVIQRIRFHRTRKGIDLNIFSLKGMLILMEELGLKVTPPPDFDEKRYLEDNSDVAAAVRAGTMASAYYHFLRFGHDEGRSRPTIMQ